MTHEKKIWKGIASILLSLAIVLGMMPGMNLSVFADDATFSGGSGTADAPYLITSAEDWNALATSVNSGTSYSGEYFKLTNDITVSSMIGTNSHPDLINSHPFSGTFDGDGHTLNLAISSSSTHGAAPFSATNNATIKNLNVTGSVVGGIHSSGLVGVPNGTLTVENCTISAAVSGSTHHGGIVGHAFNATVNLNSCTFDGSLTGGTALGGMIGWSGLSSSSRPTIRLTDCLFSGTYSGGAFDPVGYTATSGDSATLTDFYTTKVRSGNANYPLTTSGTINRAYTINFVNEGGTSLQSSIVRNGQTPSYTGETPSKPADAQYTYTFAGWTPEIAAVTGDATYTATYTSTVNEYTIRFVNDDGTELQSSEVAYGETPSYIGATPTRAADAQYTYTFDDWNEAIVPVTGDATYTATYTSMVNEYTIRFVNDDGTELQSSSVAYGVTPVYNGETPTKDATAQYTYTYAGWDAEIIAVTGDATYTATYTNTVNNYTVTFNTNGGNAIDDQAVNYNDTATRPADPTKAGYTFAGWYQDATLSVAFDYSTPITADTTIYAKWTENPVVPTAYMVYFNTDGGSEISAQVVAAGGTATKPADPTKEGYTFAGWYQDATLNIAFNFDTAITSDVALYAKWTENTEPDQVVYNIISGANAVWSQGEYVLTVRRDVNDETCYSHFTGVQIDGITLVAGTDYTAAPGSTVITFKAEMMERLSLGSHTITVLFDDGRVETTLTKQQAGTNSSTTGAIASTGEDVSKNIIAAVICFVVSGLMLGIALIEKRKLYS